MSTLDSMYLVNCDAFPFIPEGWSVEEHKKGGNFQFDSIKISLYLSQRQKNGGISGIDLKRELDKKPLINANVLDYLLHHPDLIPENWKSELVFFWGTIYRDSEGKLCVRCLYRFGSDWSWTYAWLHNDFDSECFTAIVS